MSAKKRKRQDEISVDPEQRLAAHRPGREGQLRPGTPDVTKGAPGLAPGAPLW